MKFIMIHGGIAVGKMTVAQELAKITELKLFHSHMTVEPIIELFGKFDRDVIIKLRSLIYEEFAKTDNYGMVTTAAWNFENSKDNSVIHDFFHIFEQAGAEIYCVELYAPQEVRLLRNETENRLLHKPSMRNLEASRQRLLDIYSRRRYQSKEGEIPYNHIKIDNTKLAPDVVARMIKDKFGL